MISAITYGLLLGTSTPTDRPPPPTAFVRFADARSEARAARVPLLSPPEPAAAATPPPPDDRRPAWIDNLHFGAFVDAYFSHNANNPKPQGASNLLRAFDTANGFSLPWAGLDVGYEGQQVAAQIDLRFGTGPNAGWADDALPGIQHVKQAFGTWHALPDERLSIDFGRFDTIYGAEVAESWNNHNYTRGALYNLAQPFWHTGLRLRSQPTSVVGVTGMLVNGWGHIVDNNLAKSVGLAVSLTPGDVVGISLGYLGGAQSDDVDPETGEPIAGANWDLRHLADVVITVDLPKLDLALNADYVIDDTPTGYQQWYGAMLSAQLTPRPWLGFGARAEYLVDPDGALTGLRRNTLATGTFTVSGYPTPKLGIRLDTRADYSQRALFPALANPDEPHNLQLTFTLGLTLRT